MSSFYLTTPIYYVNDIPHIGHAYTTVAADILARFNRQLGNDVFFLTGTDEHGQKVQKAADEKGLTPQEHADRMVGNFRELWKKLNISNDAFIRTTDTEHKMIVQQILDDLYRKGEIVRKQYRGWYCTPDERFWTEKEIIEGNCPECGRPVDEIEEENYFFLMSKYQERLIRHIEENPGYILPETRRNEVMGFLKARELGDLCISRPKARLSWGVTLPFDEDYVTYVWFDALLNYFSATQYLLPDKGGEAVSSIVNRQSSTRNWWPADHHIVGKDILTTHAVYWSAMLMALEMDLPQNLFAHGWWTVDGKKMSKSLGNVVDPNEMIQNYGVDAFRYFLFREVPFGLDGDFSISAIVGRINSDLANDLGNLATRGITMAIKYFEGKIPEPSGVEDELKVLAVEVLDKLKEDLSRLDFHKALDHIWSLIRYINKYIDTNQPWSLAKAPESRERLSTVIYSVLEGLRFTALYISPFMPESADRIMKQLGMDIVSGGTALAGLEWGGLVAGRALERPEPLFPRIDTKTGSTAGKEKGKRPSAEKKTTATGKEGTLIGIEDFARVELKVGRILEAERVEGSKKLIKLKVDTGEIRQIVAGIGKDYEPAELPGKKVVVVANLKPAKLMGIESQGMLLAAGDNESLAILSPEKDIKEGTRVR